MTNGKNLDFVAGGIEGVRRSNRGSETVLVVGRDLYASFSLTAENLAVLWGGETISKPLRVTSRTPSLQEECSHIILKKDSRRTQCPCGSRLFLEAEIHIGFGQDSGD